MVRMRPEKTQLNKRFSNRMHIQHELRTGSGRPTNKSLQITFLSIKQNREYTHHSEASLCNHICSRKAIRITYSECVFVELGIQHAMCMRRIVTCGLLRLYNIFQHLSHERQGFEALGYKPEGRGFDSRWCHWKCSLT